MSWLFSQALVEEYLGGNFLDGERSVPLNGSHTQQAYLPPDKMTDFSRLSRFGMTFKPLTESRGKELLTLFLEDFPVKTFPQQEAEQELMEKDQECGSTWPELLAKYDPDLRLWKTAQCSFLEDSDKSLVIWPRSGMTVAGESWALPMLEPITNVTGFGSLLPTPTTQGLNGGANSRKAAIARGAWPTPTVCGNYNRKGASAKSGNGLATAVAMSLTSKVLENTDAQIAKVEKFPTPAARDYRHPNLKTYQERGGGKKGEQLPNAVGGPLNPMWVEWLMGWPLGWTELKPLEMGKFLYVPQPPGDF